MQHSFYIAFFVATLWGASATTGNRLRSRPRRSKDFLHTLEFKHRLRVCNAFPYPEPLSVFRNGAHGLGNGDMPYGTCRDVTTPLKAGDSIEFKVGDAQAGTFTISDVPSTDAVLLLVIHRHDELSAAVSFESHVFSNLLNAQVATIDTYKGKAKGRPQIMDAHDGRGGGRYEDLRYNAVVAVNPGEYVVALLNEEGESVARTALKAKERQSYIVLRAGVEAIRGKSYPQSLIVFPSIEEKQMHRATTAPPDIAPSDLAPDIGNPMRAGAQRNVGMSCIATMAIGMALL